MRYGSLPNREVDPFADYGRIGEVAGSYPGAVGAEARCGGSWPIDIYNLTLLTSASTGEVTSHTRLENVKDKEVEVKISAAVREEDGEDGVLMYSTEARTPRTVVKRMALETPGYIVLVNRNSSDSVIASG